MRCIYISDQNQKLLQELEKHNLTDLYDKFLKQGLTQDNVWTFPSDVLDQMDLRIEEKTRYLSVKEAMTGTDAHLLLKFCPLIIT